MIWLFFCTKSHLLESTDLVLRFYIDLILLGKHNNWSVATNTGENLMEPGNTPSNNMRFMVMLTALIRAVSVHGDLLRSAVAVPGN